MSEQEKNIVIFASGGGTNALNIIHHFNKSGQAKVSAIFTNNKEAGVINKAIENRVAVQYFNRKDFYETTNIIDWVNIYKPDIIVLAGFLWLVPGSFIQAFNGKIINLHPALLPKFGGKGMYGRNVHQAVLDAGVTETGITIHYVNEDYDKGEIILQEKFNLSHFDDVSSIEQKIHQLEYIQLPKAIEIVLGL
ncbi:MAG: phosphoribosylglycinamide formyltransferase [Bacteroidota bacterium]|nr:phosphoribosylglycinamide formyltransferase [Bacteroidota bacterium]